MRTLFLAIAALLTAPSAFADKFAVLPADFVGTWHEKGINGRNKNFYDTVILKADGTLRSYWEAPQMTGYNPGFWSFDAKTSSLLVIYCGVSLDEPQAPSPEDCQPVAGGMTFTVEHIDLSRPPAILKGTFLNTDSRHLYTPMTWTR